MTDPTNNHAEAADPAVIDPIDALLLDELRLAASQMDPPPARLVEAAKAAYVWRTIDEELAHLQFDSLAGSDVLVRGASSTPPSGIGADSVHLSFATAQASIEVDVEAEAILGQVVPSGCTEVSLLLGSGERLTTPCDEHGQFVFDRRPSGPIRLVARQASGDVVTEWFTV